MQLKSSVNHGGQWGIPPSPFTNTHTHTKGMMVHVLPTWDDGDGVSLPGHDADIFLHGSWDEALEHSYVAPHRALIRHPHGVGLPENCTSTRKTLRQLIYGLKGNITSISVSIQ